MNNYHAHLLDDPKPRGLRNIVANIENMGNIMFLETITRQLNATAVSAFLDIQRPEYINENFDILVLPLANMISPVWVAHHDLLNALDQLTIPIIMMSVGVQVATIEELSTFEISEDAKRILNLTKKTGTIIGTRGDITSQVLHDRGYTNIQTIGCPSMYYRSLRLRDVPELPKIAIHASLYGNPRLVGHLLSFGVKYADAYIAQNEARFLVSKYNILPEVYSTWTTNERRLKELENVHVPYTFYNDGQFSPEQLRHWMDSHVDFFTDIDTWIHYLKSFDLSVGTRYHGTIAAILAGTPALLYTIDMRTRELAEYHGIPHTSLDQISTDTSVNDIRAMIDYSMFESLLATRKSEYISYLAKHSLALKTD